MPTMNQVLITEQTLTDLADKIRAKTGSTNTFTPSEMVAELDNIGFDWSALGYSGTPDWLQNEYDVSVEFSKMKYPEPSNDLKENLLIYNNENMQYSTSNTYRYAGYRVLQEVKKINIGSYAGGTSAGFMFDSCYGLKKFANMINEGKYKCTSLQRIFSNCFILESVNNLDTNGIVNMEGMFSTCAKLETAPQLDTSSVTDVSYMFSSCRNLKNVPFYNLPKVVDISKMTKMFNNCTSLTDESLDNILQMCISTNIPSSMSKKLSTLSVDATTSRIEALPHYQDFLDAGWTIS